MPTYKYLGCGYVYGEERSQRIGEISRRKENRSEGAAIYGRGGLKSCNCALEGWDKVGIPILMYASEILTLPVREQALDREQNRMGRFISERRVGHALRE